MRKYKYILFDTGSIVNGKIDKNDYFYMCNVDLRKEKEVEIITYPMEHLSIVFHKLRLVSRLIDRCILKKTFFQKMWYKYYLKNKYNDNENLCFIVYGYYITADYLRYLKKQYPNAKIVKLHRDSYEIWKKKNETYTEKDINELFDIQFTYDKGDASKYSMIHFDEIASVNSIELVDNYPIYDVFFAGTVKDRLDKLISIYDYLTDKGINCYFYLTGLGKRKKIKRKGIQYADDNMSYKEMLHYTVNSKVVLEVNQKNVDGFTSRFLEAVMYNKKLLTDNKSISQHKYYNPEYIQCFTNADEIDIDFIKKDTNVDFNYQGEFSPINLINLIDETLIKMDENNGIKYENK